VIGRNGAAPGPLLPVEVAMFQIAAPTLMRKLVLMAGMGLGLICAGAGGTAWYLTRCSVPDYFHQAAISPVNPREQYLFACGHVWHSVDGGQVWNRQPARGIPIGTRDGLISIDRRPDQLYLGIMINSQSSLYCLECAWTYLRPAIYASADGGRTWSFAYKFKRGHASRSGFVALLADPDRDGAAWAVIRYGDEINYYGTGTSGRFWKQVCTEYYLFGWGRCNLPDDVVRFHRLDAEAGGTVGE
jgi:hypothetical protein